MASRGAVAALRVAGVAGLAAAVGFGATGIVSGFFVQSATRTTTANGVTALDVSTGTGNVTVRVLPSGGAARVTTVRHWAFTEPTTSQVVDAGTLRLRSQCGGGDPFGRCSVDWDVALPAGAALTIRTGTGDVTLTGVTGPASVRTGTGDVALRDGRTTSLTVVTGTGDVRLGLLAPPDSLVTTTGTGDVTVALPGGASYDVTGRTGAGSRRVDVTVDASSGHLVRIDTGAGDVTVTPAG